MVVPSAASSVSLLLYCGMTFALPPVFGVGVGGLMGWVSAGVTEGGEGGACLSEMRIIHPTVFVPSSTDLVNLPGARLSHPLPPRPQNVKGEWRAPPPEGRWRQGNRADGGAAVPAHAVQLQHHRLNHNRNHGQDASAYWGSDSGASVRQAVGEKGKKRSSSVDASAQRLGPLTDRDRNAARRPF